MHNCEAVYPEGKCEVEASVEIVSNEFYVEGSPVVLMFCFPCANLALASGVFSSSESIGD
jgi:hypothetical protein